MKIKTTTIIRTAVLAVALLNQILTILGLNPLPFSEEEVYEIITMIVTSAASVWAWWENNSFTKAAILADEEYEKIKAETASEEEADGESFR